MAQPLLRKEEENRQSKEELLESGLHQKSLDDCLTEISPADSMGGLQEMWSAPQRMQREGSSEKVQQDILKTQK